MYKKTHTHFKISFKKIILLVLKQLLTQASLYQFCDGSEVLLQFLMMMMMVVMVVVMMTTIPTIINLKDPQYRGTYIYKLCYATKPVHL